MEGRVPNVGSDPINPAYYAGTACAEIIEHMPTNVGFAAKYAWRLGEKDSEAQEAGKAIWYLERQLNLEYHRSVFNTPQYFLSYCNDRIYAAYMAGKLDMDRRRIISNCVLYTYNESKDHLSTAIRDFQKYL